ncbi:MAG TPA: Smr/MutS family protein [Rhizomicrobium sp.]
MGGRRIPTDEERELFEGALADATPLKRTPRRPKKMSPPPAPVAPVPSAKPSRRNRVEASRRTAGIDGNTADRLRRGLVEPQARLDLHGLTERSAHRALVTFLRGATTRKLRLILIVTGKGGESGARHENDIPFDLGLDTRVRGVLRTMTPRWLREPGLSELIVHTSEAHRRHGGAGALYVYLRKG